jgi:OmcA/MtrC family decaheme c-type cytochrome
VVWDATGHFEYQIESADVDVNPATGRNRITVVFAVRNPVTGAYWDLKRDFPFTQSPSLSRVAVAIGWDTTEYQNTGSAGESLTAIPWGGGAAAASPISIDALRRSTALGGGHYSVQTDLPGQAQNTATVAIEGRVAWPVPAANGATGYGRVPVKSEYGHVALSSAPAVPRREVVSLDKCTQCHDGELHRGVEIPRLSLHGNNRTEELGVCVVCHNPDQTDIGYRTAGAEVPVDFKTLVHSIHGTKRRKTPFVVTGFGGSVVDFSQVRFPGNPADCLKCHVDSDGKGTFELPLAAGVKGTTVATRSIPGVSVDVDPRNNLRITPTAAVCSSCHDSAKARSHMTARRSGGAFAVLQSDLDSGRVRERCLDCHGPGRDKGVRKVHQIEGD